MKNLIFAASVFMLFSCSKTELQEKAPPSSHETAGRTADGNKSLLFGPGSYIKVDDQSALRLTTFTLEAWVMPTGKGTTTQSGSGGVRGMPIITKGRGEGDYPSSLNVNYFLAINNNKKLAADFEDNNGGNHPVTSNAVIQDNKWTHVAVSYEPETSVWKMYINGVLDITKDLGDNVTPADAVVSASAIATSVDSKGVAQGFFNGNIDEIRVWNVARTDAEISDNYKRQLNSGSGLVTRYSLNENEGTKVNNSITSSSDGTIFNDPQWTTGFDPDVAVHPDTKRPDHVFFVWLENKGYNSIVGSSNAPYINSLVKRGTLFKNSYALTHPSQPNYIQWFSGQTNEIQTNNCINYRLKSPTMWNLLDAGGASMKWLSESLPAVGSTVCEAYPYVKKHNPMPSFATTPADANQPLTYINLQDTSTFNSLDNVICITPNMLHDMHDGTVREGDDWLKTNFSKLIDWCMTNNSIFVLYYDESETSADNRIPVVMVGEHVKQNYTIDTRYDHYNWSLTVTSLFGVAKTAWQANPSAWNNIEPRSEVTGWEN